MFCQLLLVGYKEIYWILPKHHISWCSVSEHHWNLFFDQHMSSFLCSKFQSTNKEIFTHWFIHLLIHLKCLLTSWSGILYVIEKFTMVCAVLWEFRGALNSFWSNLERFSWGFEILVYLSAKENKPLDSNYCRLFLQS